MTLTPKKKIDCLPTIGLPSLTNLWSKLKRLQSLVKKLGRLLSLSERTRSTSFLAAEFSLWPVAPFFREGSDKLFNSFESYTEA